MDYYLIRGKVEILLIVECYRNWNKLLQESILVLCINVFSIPYSEKEGHLNYYADKKRNVIWQKREITQRFPDSLLILLFLCYRDTWLRWKSTPPDWTCNWFWNLLTMARQISTAHQVLTGHPNVARYRTFIFSKWSREIFLFRENLVTHLSTSFW